ncbi:MAG: hypothetical protein ACE5FB_00240 [Candidatus Binatia bacterium]
MNRRRFFGALLGTAAVGSVSNRTTMKASPDKFITRFTLKTKFGDYFFYWTGWKREISTVVNVGQWIAEPVDGELDQERPAFYAATTGSGGALIHMNYVMDLSHKTDYPLITDKSSREDKWEAQDEALNRLIKMIEDYELPQLVKYATNSHISDRAKLRPGDLIDMGGGLQLPRDLTSESLRKLRKVVKGV